MTACRRPCTECPWRKDTLPGQFSAERYEQLRITTGERGHEAPLGSPQFACHKAPEGEEFVCAGWLAAVGYYNLSARVAAAYGHIPHEAFQPGDGWPELYESYAELLAVHGVGATPDWPKNC